MAKKKKVYVEPKKDLTTMLFTSLMLILLTFFIVLSSLGVQDNRKQRLAMNSLLGSFGILSGGQSPYQTLSGKDLMPQSAPITSDAVNVQRVRAAIKESGVSNGMGISEGSLGTTITLRSDILFEGNTDRLTDKSRRALDSLSTTLKAIDNHIIITGHTDSVPVEEAPFFSNWNLSAARSFAVFRYLSEAGISQERMAAYGMGSQHPITSNDTVRGRELNKRVEIIILGALPGDRKAREEKTEIDEAPAKTFQYKGFKFRLEEM